MCHGLFVFQENDCQLAVGNAQNYWTKSKNWFILMISTKFGPSETVKNTVFVALTHSLCLWDFKFYGMLVREKLKCAC